MKFRRFGVICAISPKTVKTRNLDCRAISQLCKSHRRCITFFRLVSR